MSSCRGCEEEQLSRPGGQEEVNLQSLKPGGCADRAFLQRQGEGAAPALDGQEEAQHAALEAREMRSTAPASAEA